MGNFPLLDLILGLSFVYLLLALVCTTVMEWIAQARNLRGQGLEAGIRRLLGEEKNAAAPLTAELFAHPLLQALSADDRKPSYVPAKVFATAIRDLLKQPGLTERAAPELKASFAALKAAPSEAGAGDQLPSEAALAEWFDQGMERTSGSYKRKTRKIVLWLAFAVAIAMNADTLTLTTRLWQNPTLRAYLVERAKVRLEQGAPLETVEYSNPTSPTPSAPIKADSGKSPNRLLAEEKNLLGDLFGWTSEPAAIARMRQERGGWLPGTLLWLLLRAAGWTLTAFAISLGAPFWFDTLNRFMSIRSAGGVPAKYGETKPGDSRK